MRASLRGTEIYFDIDGAGLVADGARMRERPVAFLIHGGPGSDHSSLKARYGALAQRMQLIYFDQRGQGRSARGDSQQYTLDENVEDLEALRCHLGVDRVVSIGTSYGGMVAMAHAARYPQAVSHLVVIAAVAHAGYVERARQIVAERGTTEQQALCEDLFAGRLDTAEKFRHFLRAMSPLYARRDDPALSQAGLERIVLSAEALNRAHGPAGFLRRFDLRPELGAITAPTLILVGRYDWISAPEFSEEIQRLIVGSQLRIFEESAHAIAGDEPQKFFETIAEFVGDNAQAAAP